MNKKMMIIFTGLYFLWIGLASCKQEQKYKPDPTRVARGEQLFIIKGCVGCHQLKNSQAKFKGPNLEQIQTKVNSQWLVNWLKESRHYLPDSNMPNYYPNNQEFIAQGFKQNLSIPHSKEKVLEESIAMARYLLSQASSSPPEKKSGISKVDTEAGKQMFIQQSCVGCHRIGNLGDYNGPALDKIGDKVKADWLMNWLKHPKKYDPETVMPSYSHLSEQELKKFTTYLLSLKGSKAQSANIKISQSSLDGKALITQYGCYNCHAIQGFENISKPVGSDLTMLSKREIKDFPFGSLNIEKSRQNWVYNKIMRPQIFNFSGKTLMPQYNLNPEEGRDLTDFVLDYSSQQHS